MQFDNIDNSHKYLKDILCIIRQGISQKHPTLNKKKREGLKTQQLVEIFNVIGTTGLVSDTWIGAQKEHEREKDTNKEDVYFHLNDDNYTRVFYVEAKRLPKYKSVNSEEYVTGVSTSRNPSGGIQRYKLGSHGNVELKYNGIIAYIENKSIETWLSHINKRISEEYPNDSLLASTDYENEFVSTHSYLQKNGTFMMHHFWINLVKN
ncbi:hypothetical protein [Proteiniphilum sp.]|uniref:hypothetical protein n=1 Tax=Proteiniphilum sp. TaxID=1926877 RepID=UPI0033323514